ncbi:MAG: NADH-quinone oxidoreductase subunit C [Calditrichota bacterium]
MTPEELTRHLSERFPYPDAQYFVDKGHAVAVVPLNKLFDLIQTIKDAAETRFNLLMDLTVVDWLERKPRFDLVYHLYSVEHNHRLRIKAGLEDGQPAPTLTKLWPIADWLEREMWDLYGVKFASHPNLKRILLYDEFKGHPLRKDYPYDKRQPLEEETWPSRPYQVKMAEAERIHRP